MERLKIAIISDWYSEGMGYSENMLPKALAKLGHEVHLITTNAQVYYNSPNYNETYEPFLGPPIVKCGVQNTGDYMVHRLPFLKRGKERLLEIKGLYDEVSKIGPHILQVLDVSCLSTVQAALITKRRGLKLFGECHNHASVFIPRNEFKQIVAAMKWTIYKNTIGRFVSRQMEKCYPISLDAATIANKYFGISKRKLEIQSLGVDTDLFRAANQSEDVIRRDLRRRFGFEKDEIVCIYTGRLTRDKNPLCLAKAINYLTEKGLPFKGLFVGNGDHDYVEKIKACKRCVVHPFVPAMELPKFYWSSDIGIWPRQESTSQLDATACGLPLIVSNRVQVVERITGNGLVYDEDSEEDLAKQILNLTDYNVRRKLGAIGSAKVFERFSWRSVAMSRLADYIQPLNRFS